MIEQFLDADSVAGILLQAFVQKVPSLSRHEYVAGNAYLVLHYFYQLLLFCYFEGVFANKHLVHHYTQRPDIDFLVVLFPTEDLRTDVERCAAESSTEAVVYVDGPAEVTKFDHVLGRRKGTSCRTMF